MDLEINHLDSMIKDIYNEFNFLSFTELRQALRRGALGHYGVTYRLNTHEVCIWIRKYLESKKSKLNL